MITILNFATFERQVLDLAVASLKVLFKRSTPFGCSRFNVQGNSISAGRFHVLTILKTSKCLTKSRCATSALSVMREKFFRYVRSWDEVELVNIVIPRDSRQSICGPRGL